MKNRRHNGYNEKTGQLLMFSNFQRILMKKQDFQGKTDEFFLFSLTLKITCFPVVTR